MKNQLISKTAKQLFTDEIRVFDQARRNNDHERAWKALERAHIVGQPYLGLHLSSHWKMLGFAVSRNDWREVSGQIFRLALAPIGNFSGRLPVGNTGRSDVSAFRKMPFPRDLQEKFSALAEKGDEHGHT